MITYGMLYPLNTPLKHKSRGNSIAGEVTRSHPSGVKSPGRQQNRQHQALHVVLIRQPTELVNGLPLICVASLLVEEYVMYLTIHMCMYTCICIHVYIYIYIHIHIRIFVYIHNDCIHKFVSLLIFCMMYVTVCTYT